MPDAAPDAVEPETPLRLRWPWAVGTGAALLVIAAAIAFWTAGPVAKADAASASANKSSEILPYAKPRGVTAEPKPIDPSALAQHQSEDARRSGHAAYSTGDLATALTQYQSAVDVKPDDPEAQNNLAQVLVRQNRAEEALPHFDEAIRLNQQKWAYRFNRARAYALLNRFSEAVTDYRAAAALFPDDYATHYNLGLVLLRMKEYPDAVASLERAVALAPGEPSFLISLGTAYVAVAQPDKAKATFQQFLKLAPEDPEVPRVKALLEALAAAAS